MALNIEILIALGVGLIVAGLSGFDPQGGLVSSADRALLTLGAVLLALGLLYRRKSPA